MSQEHEMTVSEIMVSNMIIANIFMIFPSILVIVLPHT